MYNFTILINFYYFELLSLKIKLFSWTVLLVIILSEEVLIDGYKNIFLRFSFLRIKCLFLIRKRYNHWKQILIELLLIIIFI